MVDQIYDTFKNAMEGKFKKLELFGNGIAVDGDYLSTQDLGTLGVRFDNGVGLGPLGDIFTTAAKAKEIYQNQINQRPVLYTEKKEIGKDPYPNGISEKPSNDDYYNYKRIVI